ncbi:MAG TPA: hypothetical protein VFL85_04905, partial [Candidatus Saccharimonadales bacterium]|nr:hypothetical protein [Candidatus Saccharimonadales bacterium]
IKPLGGDNKKPSLDELLAQEEAKSAALEQASAAVATPPAEPASPPAVTPEVAADESSAPAPQPGNTFTPNQPEDTTTPSAQKKNDGFDPNSISL